MAELKVYILCRFALESQLYLSWLQSLTRPYEVVQEFPGTWIPPDDCGLIVTHLHYRWDEVGGLRRILNEGNIPILILADGILEYRNIFEHPELADGSVFQPLMGHKLACIGRGQARVVESWGNIGKCEAVGYPRLDRLLTATPEPPAKTGPFRLLICSANKPAFNEIQRIAVVESLQHLRERLTENPLVNGRPTEVVWRLTDGLNEEVGLPDAPPLDELPPLHDVIAQVDAVITTPSTIFLESALLGRPTAVLDFHNTPHYVPAAWMINAPKHLNAILRELADPPAAKMLFQNHVLHDQLECNGPATPRLIELIERMIQVGQESRTAGIPLEFPHRILTDERFGFSPVESGYDLSQLYPENPILKNSDLEQLQLELNLLKGRLEEIPDQLYRVLQQLDERNERIDELQNKYNSTKDRLDAAKERLKKWRTGVFRLGDPAPGKTEQEAGSETTEGESE